MGPLGYILEIYRLAAGIEPGPGYPQGYLNIVLHSGGSDYDFWTSVTDIHHGD